jgi:hypothetical protein
MAVSRNDARLSARTAVAVETEAYRPPYLAAGIAALAVWLLYAITLARTTAFWDTSEYIATAHILGVPHPPGNPLFVVLARAWEVLLAPTGLSVAIRINLFSATMSALAHGFWFLLAHRVLAFFSGDRTFRLVGAAASVAISATAFTVWNQSNVNEKVYTVSLFTIALLSWLALRWRDSRSGDGAVGVRQGKDDNLLLLMVFILALSVGNHLMAFLMAPALVLFIVLVEPRTFANWRLYAAAVPVLILGLSIHLFLPLRAGLDPIINEADPSCPSVASAITSVVTYGKAGCEDLSASLAREQYSKPSVMTDPTDPRLESPRGIGLMIAQVGNWLQYYDWQWSRSIGGMDPTFPPGRLIFTLLFTALGVIGAMAHYRADRPTFWYVAALFATLSFGLVFYLNFKYGYSYGDYVGATREAREVRERDYFFIVGFSVWGVWAGIGLAHLWSRLAAKIADTRPELDTRRRLMMASPLLGLALIPLALNYDWARRDNDYTARDWAYNLLMSVEPYGVLFTNGDNDTFPLWYMQEVEGVRRDVTVIVMSYLNTPWYVEQLRDLTQPCDANESPAQDPTRVICQRPFDRERGPSFYTAQLAPPTPGGDTGARELPLAGGAELQQAPTRSIFPEQFDDARIEQIVNQGAFLTSGVQPFVAGGIQTMIPEQSVIQPADMFMAAIITNSIDDRPIYFASTTQAYRKLNLMPHLIRRGVALKLSGEPVTEDAADGIIALPEAYSSVLGTFVDVGISDSLIWNVYNHHSGFPDEWTKWVDQSTQGIPFYYWHAHLAAAAGHAMAGTESDLAAHQARMEEWSRMADLGSE